MIVRPFVISIALALCLGGCSATPELEPTPLAVQGAPIDSRPAESQAVASPQQGRGLKTAPTDPAARAALSVDVPAPSEKDGFVSLSFTQLSDFPYETDDTGKLVEGAVLPDEIAALNGKEVAVSGFVVPIEFREDKVSGLILVRNQLLCCYGEEPKLNEWVFVEADPPVEMITDVPVTLFGKFEAAPDEEEGMVISLYRMKATRQELMDS